MIYKAMTIPDCAGQSIEVEGPYMQKSMRKISGKTDVNSGISHRIQTTINGHKVWLCVDPATLQEVR